ncbi:MAG TPA: hypothetical protein VH482_20820 [Thermomicrobiales bacterium]|jgi:hypothetical protein
MSLDATQLTAMSQQQLDELFRDGGVERVPTGDADGTAIVQPGSWLSHLTATLIHLLIWQGKVFDARGEGLRNKITPLRVRAIRANVYKEKSWFDGKECIVLDYSRTSLVAHWIRDEIREVSPGRFLGIVYWGKKKLVNFFLVFPT